MSIEDDEREFLRLLAQIPRELLGELLNEILAHQARGQQKPSVADYHRSLISERSLMQSLRRLVLAYPLLSAVPVPETYDLAIKSEDAMVIIDFKTSGKSTG